MNDFPYLDIIERPLDSAQRTVCFTTENAVIAAGAGSGKTQVLATRFAWLVISKGIKASEILTLTFTDKAASEMYQRIYGTLRYFAEYTAKTDAELRDFFMNVRKLQEERITPALVSAFREAERDLTEDKRWRAREALLDFANAHIQTLDSYCGSIVRQCANRYGISPDFTVGTSDTQRDIKNQAFSFVLSHCENPGIAAFCKPGNIQNFAERVFARSILDHTSVATEDGWFSDQFAHQAALIATAWNKSLCTAESGSLVEFLETFRNTLETHKDFGNKKYQAWVQSALDFIQNAENEIGSIDGISPQDFDARYQSILPQTDSVLRIIDGAKQLSAMTGKISAVNKALAPLTKSKDDDAALRAEILSLIAFIRTYREQKEFMALLDAFLHQVNESKRQSGALSFNDVTELALKVLLENEDVRNTEKRAYKKIMIDEFQDNNAKNRDLLYLLSLKDGAFESADSTCVITPDGTDPESLHALLTGERDMEKLFFVGDEKQSIYKFRNADVSVFNKLTTENKLVPMSFNYRSEPPLIQAFNMFFKDGSGIFLTPEGLADFEAHYATDAHKNGLEELPALTAQNVPVHVRLINERLMNANEDEAPFYIPKNEQLGYFIAKSIYETASRDFKGLPKSKWKWNSFAILDKSRSHRSDITKYLGLFNIPFQVDQFKNIFEEGVINDIYNFLRLCVYPSDTNAFAAYLCSPFCGLSENAAEIVLSFLVDIHFHGHDEPDFVFNPSERSADKLMQDALRPEEFQRFLSARAFYEEIKKPVLQNPLTETLTTLWHDRGYKYETLLSERARLCAEHFDMLFELARTCDSEGKSVSWFIDELERLKKSMRSDDSDIDAANVRYPLERSQAVQIMTIHKSKGLQFDHVYVLGCTNVRRKADVDAVFYSEQSGLSLKPTDGSKNFFALRQKTLEDGKELAEFRRLIYVALTRAIKDVFILGRIDALDLSEKGFRLVTDMTAALYPESTSETNTDYALENAEYAPGAPFDYQQIEPVTYAGIARTAEQPFAVRGRVLSNALLNGTECEPFDAECHTIPRLAPSKLREEAQNAGAGAGAGKACSDGSTNAASSVPAKNSSQNSQLLMPFDDAQVDDCRDEYAGLSEILRKYDAMADERSGEPDVQADANALPGVAFTPADFGTLVHDYLCKQALGVDVNEYLPAEPLFKNLSAEDKQKIISICMKMCTEFRNNTHFSAFRSARNAGRLAEAEYEFTFFNGTALLRGSIDLIYEAEDGNFVIVDYKTDRHIRPEEHFLQQKCYRDAARDLVPHEGAFRCYLYYLRFDKTIDISAEF